MLCCNRVIKTCFAKQTVVTNENKNFFKVNSFLKLFSQFKYINLGNQLHYKKYNQKLHHVEYYDGK